MSAAANTDLPLTGAAQSINRQTLTAIIWICFSVASLFVALRLTVRWRQNHSFLADDYWIIWAWMCLLTMASLQTRQLDALYYTTYLSAGRIQVTAETVAKTEDLTRWQFPIIKLFWTVLWSVKASFMAVFYRLVKPFTCNSPHEIWMQTFNVIYSTTVDIASDLLIMALPITVLPSLQLDRKKKIGLGLAFSLAIIIICVAIVRMTQVIRGETVDLVGLAIWGAVETATAVVVGSLPPLKALLTRRVKKYHTSTKRNTQRYGGQKSQPATMSSYGPNTTSRSVMVTESIPLDDLHRSNQMNGRIYVQKTYETHFEHDNSSREYDDEATIVKGQTNAWAT
ncbi:hypothetical protein CSPAE12_01525 [Colletotrichum incanum]|nr:hypothetical protein CSPAE12_01525 [Colletotrichum incanum]